MDRLFRDWRFALLWVIGISAMAAAFFARGGGNEQASAAVVPPVPAMATQAQQGELPRQAEEDSIKFGEPLMDTTPFDPNPPEPKQSVAPDGPTPLAAPEEATAPAP